MNNDNHNNDNGDANLKQRQLLHPQQHDNILRNSSNDISFNVWNELPASKTSKIGQKLMSIGESIWFCTDSNYGECGIVEYDIINHKFNVIKYPQNIEWISNHSCCTDQHSIYIVDGNNGNLIIFNTKIKQFVHTIEIPKIGYCNTSIMFL